MLSADEIRGYKLFSGLNENELTDIARFCQRQMCSFNDVIFDPQTPSENLFIAESGNEAIQIEVPVGEHEDRIVVHTLSKGEAFGWVAIGPHHIRTATARCLNEASVIAINGKLLMEYLEKNNHAGYIVMRNLAGIINTRLAYTTIAFRHEVRKFRKMALV
jgi:CRP/FNR family transcriptional regulator, cyclic AMP receptor protein